MCYRDAYVQMKAKEKGIDQSTLHRGKQGELGDKGGKPKPDSAPRKFNAFKEMEKAKKGFLPALANIPDDVDIVGKRPEVKGRKAEQSNGKKRERDDDGEERDGKNARTEVSFRLYWLDSN